MNTGTHTHADARSVRIPQFWVPTPTGHRRARHTAAAFERELKAQLEAQRLTAPPRQTAASLTQTFFFLLKKSRSDRCENHTGVCVPTSLRTWVNTECVYDRNDWDVHSLFINTYRVRLLDESRPWQVPRLTRSWFLGDVECRADTESSQSALKSQGQNSHHNYQWWIIDWVRNIQGVLQRMWALHPLWLFDSSSPSVALSLSCRTPRELNAQTGN